jgi:hypothetical protein
LEYNIQLLYDSEGDMKKPGGIKKKKLLLQADPYDACNETTPRKKKLRLEFSITPGILYIHTL